MKLICWMKHTDRNFKISKFTGLQSSKTIAMIIFDSRIVRRTVCGSVPSRMQKLLQLVVALENQHALR